MKHTRIKRYTEQKKKNNKSYSDYREQNRKELKQKGEDYSEKKGKRDVKCRSQQMTYTSIYLVDTHE